MPDAVTLRGLRYSKHTYHRAQELSRQGDEYSRATCIHRLDNCVEWILNLACGHFGRQEDSRVSVLIERVEAEISGSFSEGDRMRSLRRHRNQVQHDMVIPDERTCEEYVDYTHSFLQDVARQVWGVDFDDLRLADLIEHDEIRGLTEQAEGLIEEAEYSEAVGRCIDTFNYVVNGAEDEGAWEGLIGHAGQMTSTFIGGQDPFKPLDTIEMDDEEVEELRAATRESLLLLGQASTVAQFFTPIQKIKFIQLINRPDAYSTEAEAQEILDFTIDFVLQLQEEGLPPVP